jgi:hypothetical protein
MTQSIVGLDPGAPNTTTAPSRVGCQPHGGGEHASGSVGSMSKSDHARAPRLGYISTGIGGAAR